MSFLKSQGALRGRSWETGALRGRIQRAGPQLLRKLTQLSVLGFVVVAAGLAPWRNFKLAHNSERLVTLMNGETWGRLYGFTDDTLSLAGDPTEQSYQILGMPWAGTVFGFETVDPIMALAGAISGELAIGLLLSAVMPVLVALVLGRVFCSHLCPARLVFELGQAARRGLLRLGMPLPAFRPKLKLGGFVLVGGLAASALSGMGVFVLLLPYVTLSAAIFVGITGGSAGGLLGIAVGTLLVDALLAPGLVCTSLCPTGFLLENLGRFSIFRLVKAREPACPSTCTVCIDVCPYALSPREQTHDPACDRCGACASHCPKRILSRRLVLPRRALPIVTAGVIALMSTTGLAHHNKGLPHYGYYENYPQVPTEEHVYIQDGWEIGATVFNFQGLERRDADTPNDVKIYLYLYDLKHDAGYTGAVNFEIRYGDEVVSKFTREKVDEEAVYSTRETLPYSGRYVIVARPAVRPDLALELPFRIDLAADAINWWLVASITLPVLLVFLFAFFGRSRLRRKRIVLAATLMFATGASAQPASQPASMPGTASGPEGELRSPASQPASMPASMPASHAADHRHAADEGTSSPRPLAVAVANHSHEMFETEDGGQVMVMGGIPKWLFLLGIALILVLSFVGVELLGPRASAWRFNLTRRKRHYAILRSRKLQAIPQIAMVVVLALLLYAGLFGSRVANITPIAVWTVWWGGLVFAVVLIGPAFCFSCPWDGLANLMTRLRAFARVEPVTLSLPFPAWLKSLYPALALFVCLTWLELGFGVTTNPRTTAYMGLAMTGAAVLFALLFDKKRFCHHFCPVGRISGMYANFAPVEVRARNPYVCGRCTTEECLHGNERGYPCPTGISLKRPSDATYCTLCSECFKSCDKQNVALNLRAFGADLARARVGRIDEAWFALSLLALTLFHGLSMTPAWESFRPGGQSILKWMGTTLGTPRVLNFTLGMVVVMAIPVVLYALSVWLGAAWAKYGVSARDLFVQYAFSILPVALFYHLAHNLMHVVMEGGELITLLGDPLGDGSNYLGLHDVHVGSLMSDSWLWYTQVSLILIGHVFGIVVAHRISRRLYADKRAATKSLLPMLVMMVLLSVCGLGLMAMDMNMRAGRM